MSPAGIAFTVIGSLCIGLPLLGGLSYFLFEKFRDKPTKTTKRKKTKKQKRLEEQKEIQREIKKEQSHQSLLGLGYSEEDIKIINEAKKKCRSISKYIYTKKYNIELFSFCKDNYHHIKELEAEFLFGENLDLTLNEKIKIIKLTINLTMDFACVVSNIFDYAEDLSFNNIVSQMVDLYRDKKTKSYIELFTESYTDSKFLETSDVDDKGKSFTRPYTDSEMSLQIYEQQNLRKYLNHRNANLKFLFLLSRLYIQDEQIIDLVMQPKFTENELSIIYYALESMFWSIDKDVLFEGNELRPKLDIISRMVEKKIQESLNEAEIKQ